MLLIILSFSIQYDFSLFIFKCNRSFLSNFITNPMGVTTPKKITPIIIGETILPKNNPNFIHILFNGVNIFELIRPKIRNIEEIIIDQTLKSSPDKTGHKAMTKKTIKKTNPKLRLDGNSNCFILIIENANTLNVLLFNLALISKQIILTIEIIELLSK